VRKIKPKKPPRQMLITPINDIMRIGWLPGTPSPTKIPKAPVPKSTSVIIFSLWGLTYFIDVLLKIEHY